MLVTVIVFGAAIDRMGKNGIGDMAQTGWASALLVAFALDFSRSRNQTFGWWLVMTRGVRNVHTPFCENIN